MGTFVPPASLGSVVPNSPAAGVSISSSDQLSMDYIIGKTIIGGGQFADTLGSFSPVVIDKTGLKLNSSDATPGALRFHNTGVTLTDELLYFTNSGAIAFAPNSAASVNTPLVIADRSGTFMGWVLYPAYTSGTTHPGIQVNDPPGTTTLTMFNEVWYGFQFSTNYYANYLVVSGAAGNSPYIQAFGTLANVNIVLQPKGSGATYFSTQFANYTYAWGANAGTGASFGVTGSDTNIDLILSPQGTGIINFLYASTALGGGAAPTLGTIGGTGPANAAQAAWGKVKFNGTTYFVPLWT